LKENEYSEVYNQHINPHKNNPTNLYFLSNVQDIYIGNLISNLLALFFAKTAEALCFRLKAKFNFFRKQYFWLRRNSRLWTLLTMVIEGNLVVIVFNCCLQLLVPMHFSFANKLNFVVCVLFLFAALSYSAMFYQTIYAFEKKGAAETILNYSEYSAKSFFLESQCFLLRTFTRGVLQGLTLQNYETQILCLALSDVAFSAAVLIFRDHFSHRIVFVCAFLYSVFFLVLDTLFAVHCRLSDSGLFDTIHYELVLEVVVLCAIGAYLSLSFSLFALKAYELYTEQTLKVAAKERNELKAQSKIIAENTLKVQVVIDKRKQ
jgi:hypothetical protein